MWALPNVGDLDCSAMDRYLNSRVQHSPGLFWNNTDDFSTKAALWEETQLYTNLGRENSRSDDTLIFTVYSVPSTGLGALDSSFHLRLVTTHWGR